jgi:MarR family transcriptional repressor of emrRAB
VLIRITPAGRRLAQKMLPPMFPQVGAMFAGFSAGDMRQFDRLLRKLAGNLDQLGEQRLP